MFLCLNDQTRGEATTLPVISIPDAHRSSGKFVLTIQNIIDPSLNFTWHSLDTGMLYAPDRSTTSDTDPRKNVHVTIPIRVTSFGHHTFIRNFFSITIDLEYFASHTFQEGVHLQFPQIFILKVFKCEVIV